MPLRNLSRCGPQLLLGLDRLWLVEALDLFQRAIIPVQRRLVGPGLGGAPGGQKTIADSTDPVVAMIVVVSQQLQNLSLAPGVDPFRGPPDATMIAKPFLKQQTLIRYHLDQGMAEVVHLLAPAAVDEFSLCQLGQAFIQRGAISRLGHNRSQHRVLEVTAGHRRDGEYPVRGLRQALDASQNDALQRAGHLRLVQRMSQTPLSIHTAQDPRLLERGHQLTDEEGIAAGPGEHHPGNLFGYLVGFQQRGQQSPAARFIKRIQAHQAVVASVPPGGLPFGLWPEEGDHQDGQLVDPHHQLAENFQAGIINPVQVLQGQDQRGLGSPLNQQPPQNVHQPPLTPLGIQMCRGGLREGYRQNVAQDGQALQ